MGLLDGMLLDGGSAAPAARDWHKIALDHAMLMAARNAAQPEQREENVPPATSLASPEWPVIPGGAQPRKSAGLFGSLFGSAEQDTAAAPEQPQKQSFWQDIWYGDQVKPAAPSNGDGISSYSPAAQNIIAQKAKEVLPLPERQVSDAGLPGAPYTAAPPMEAVQPPMVAPAPSQQPAPVSPTGGAPFSLSGVLGEMLGSSPAAAAPAPGSGAPGISILGRMKGLGGILGAVGEFAEPTPNITARALVSKGMDPDMALAVAQNPDLARVAIPQMFANPQFTDIGTDPFGNEVKGWVNPAKQTVSPINPAASGQPAQGGMQISQLLGSNLSGPALMEKLDPTTRAEVQALLDGRTPMTNPQRAGARYQMLFSLANRVDPEFDATIYKTRQELRKNLEGYGKGGQEATAANTAIEHLRELGDLGESLNNVGGAWILNKPINESVGAYRWLTEDQRPNSFNALRDLAVSEIDKFYKAAGGTGAEREALTAQIRSTSSPQQLRSVIATMATAMTGKVAELERRWQKGMGPTVDPLQVLSPESQQKVSMLQRRAGMPAHEQGGQDRTGAPQAPAITATGPGGQKIVLRNGQWVAM